MWCALFGDGGVAKSLSAAPAFPGKSSEFLADHAERLDAVARRLGPATGVITPSCPVYAHHSRCLALRGRCPLGHGRQGTPDVLRWSWG